MKITCVAKCNYDPISELIRQTNIEERDLVFVRREAANTKYVAI